jgi:hypothetical protein
MGGIIASIVQGAVSALLAPILGLFRDRSLVNQGKAEQKAADDAATVQQAEYGAKVDAAVDAPSAKAQIDKDLE